MTDLVRLGVKSSLAVAGRGEGMGAVVVGAGVSSGTGEFLGRLGEGGVEGLYVHVPFCFHKCHYCDFYSITRQTDERMGRFVDLVLAEAGQWEGRRPVGRPETVFFGGGTPSLLPLVEMRRLVRGLRERFDFSGLNEWTVEANPATLSLEVCADAAGGGGGSD